VTQGGQGEIDRVGNNLQSFQLDRKFVGLRTSEVASMLHWCTFELLGSSEVVPKQRKGIDELEDQTHSRC
jgi:hypothetical protein